MSPRSPFRFAASLALALAAAGGAALAQDVTPNSGGNGDADKVNMVIIFGDDKCPASASGEITVCARKPESERYRIPAPFRNMPGRQDESWTQRTLAYETVGSTGTNSCSAVGPGGWTGCEGKLLNNYAAEKKASPDVQFSKMIEAEREKRLSHIDADAAKTQADVEAAEKDYDARQRAVQDPGDAAPAVPASPSPAGGH